MSDPTSLLGTPLPSRTVVLERGPVSVFAQAVKSTSPIYTSRAAALEAGFDDVPLPPTFTMAAQHWGAFSELQPPPDPTASDVGAVIAGLMAEGGLILHGEQEFVYHRPAVVGETLSVTGRIADVTVKEGSGGARMTIVKAENVYADASGAPVVTATMSVIHRSKPPTA